MTGKDRETENMYLILTCNIKYEKIISHLNVFMLNLTSTGVFAYATKMLLN